MTPAANMAFLSRFKEEVEKAKAELAATGQVDPYFRAKAFYRACAAALVIKPATP